LSQSPSIPESAEEDGVVRPLCVDLDGTLIKSDSLFDAVCLFLRRNPARFWQLGLWLAHGRACLKAEVARRAPLDPTRLPYNAELLLYLQTESRRGRQIYLATGADGPLAERVAAYLGVFTGVLASDGATNLTCARKPASANLTTSATPAPTCLCWSMRTRRWWPIPASACAWRCGCGGFRWSVHLLTDARCRALC
jgi:hypothetical protein